MHLTQKEVVCRNCGNKQNYNIYNGEYPTSEKAVAVCDSCGFRSVWFDEDLKMNKQFMEAIRQLNETVSEESEKLIDDLVKRKSVDSKSKKVYTIDQLLEMVRDRGLYITSSPMFMLTTEELKRALDSEA